MIPIAHLLRSKSQLGSVFIHSVENDERGQKQDGYSDTL